MKQFNIFLLLFLCSQGIMNAQISDQVIGDTKFWATGKLKPISMTQNDRDAKVAVKLDEEYNGTVWVKTAVDSSVLDNSCRLFSSARYTGGLNQPFKLNVIDSFLSLGNRINRTVSRVYNTSTNPITLSSLSTGTYYYVGTTRSEPDSINTQMVQGATGTVGIKKATFSGLNQIASITLYERVAGVITPNTRNTYTYSSAGLTKVTPENWLVASNKWVVCTTCENITITYDNTSRIVEQVKNAPNGDSIRYVLTYIGATNKVKTFTTQVKQAGTTVWNQESQGTNIAQNPTGYPTNIDYFDGSDSARISFQYLADSAMTQRLITVKNGAAFVNSSRITQSFCTPCTAILPVIQGQPSSTTTANVGQANPSIGIAGTNIASFQWQVSTNNGGSWTNINAADTTVYLVGSYGNATSGGNFITIKAPTVAQNGHQFRVIVSNVCGVSVTSSVSVLLVQVCTVATPTIQIQPQNTTKFVGQSASFSVTATNVGSYEWYYYTSTDSITRFYVNPSDTSFTGQGTNILTLKYAKINLSSFRFFCRLVNGCAPIVTTDIVQLTVQTCNATAPVLQTQPANITVNSNAVASFTVATNTPTTGYRWQVKSTITNTWAPIFTADTIFTGQATNVLTINYAKYDYNLYKFRCNVSSCAGTTTSDSALLRVLCPGGLPTVVTDPSSVTTTVGTPKRIDVTGTNIVSAQWQVSDGNGGVFRDILPTDTTYTIGATTATNANITIKYPKRTQNGFAYRVILSNSCGDTKASVGTSLIVNFPLAVNELDVKVRIYPNPTNDVINIDLPITNFKVTLSDSKGSVMLQSENKNQISIKELPTGLYFLNVKTADGETTKKVIKN
jgi:Secretion system C-terminal sorting domain